MINLIAAILCGFTALAQFRMKQLGIGFVTLTLAILNGLLYYYVRRD